ncbi:MAG TPA: hypothetical protein VFI00_13590 [Kribbella sp.]|nr:hypothetical protein [Kribbella sp.]
MKRFVVPPTWPSPPRRSWVPPKTWRPDPSWAPPPEGWRFWVDGKGNPVRGPIGRYGGPSRRVMYAGAGALVLFLGVNLWAVSALGLFGGGAGDPQAVQVADDSTPTPSATTPAPVVPQTTTPPKPTVTPTQRPTQRPTQQPTKTRTTEPRTAEPPDPTPTKTPTTAKTTPRPSRPSTSRPPTREEILRQYCIQRGWDPKWCDPDNWPDHPRNSP